MRSFMEFIKLQSDEGRGVVLAALSAVMSGGNQGDQCVHEREIIYGKTPPSRSFVKELSLMSTTVDGGLSSVGSFSL